MAWSIELNGNTYTEASFDGYNYADETTGLPAALRDFVFHARDVLKSSSTTSVNLSTLVVSNTLNVTVEINKFFEVNQSILFYSSSVPTDYVYGVVTSYTESTGALAITIKEVSGTATYTNWVAVLGLGKAVAAAEASETNAAISETNAATSETNAAASYDNFDDRWLGDKTVDPTLDNDGGALLTGASYFNTNIARLKRYDGANWNTILVGLANVVEDTTPQLGGALDAQSNKINNLGDATAATDAVNLSQLLAQAQAAALSF